jgi:hypothetical protein
LFGVAEIVHASDYLLAGVAALCKAHPAVKHASFMRKTGRSKVDIPPWRSCLDTGHIESKPTNSATCFARFTTTVMQLLPYIGQQACGDIDPNPGFTGCIEPSNDAPSLTKFNAIGLTNLWQ